MANPLTLLMPVVPGTDPRTIAANLAKNQPEIDAALNSVGTVHYARFVLLDTSSPCLQPGTGTGNGPYVLGVITEFDGSFDAYIQDFVDKVGNVFDALLQNTVGGKEITPVAQNITAFQNYVKKYDLAQQPGATGLYEAYPYTVQQVLANGS